MAKGARAHGEHLGRRGAPRAVLSPAPPAPPAHPAPPPRGPESARLDAEARARARYYADLFESAPVGYLTMDSAGMVLDANRRALDMLGLQRSAVVGQPFQMHVAPGERWIFFQHFAAAQGAGERAGEPRNASLCMTHVRSGATFIAHLESVVVVDPMGRRVLRTVLSDETARHAAMIAARARGDLAVEKREQRETAAATRRFDDLVLASSELAKSLDLEATSARAAQVAVPRVASYCAIDLLDEGGRLRRAAFARADGAVDLPLDPYAPRGAAAVVRRGTTEHIAAVDGGDLIGLAAAPGDLPLLREHVGAYLAVPLVAHGHTLGAMSFVLSRGRAFSPNDVVLATEVARHTALALENAHRYRAAQEADRAKTEFLAMLGHELRNPLAAVVLAAQALRHHAGEVRATMHTADVVERQGSRLVRLVDDLLEVSRITRGKITLQRRRVALEEVIARAVESTGPLVDERGHHLSIALPDEPVVLDADPTRLEQVVVNLLANAARYTEPGGRIELGVDVTATEAIVRVRDSGIGIPPEMLTVIFAPFTQLDVAPDREGRGLGIGLALARTLVDMHGGRITAQSEGLGKGSEFVVRLPRAPGDAPAEPISVPRAVEEEPAPVTRRRVLVVEDNPDIAALLQEELEMHGQEVRTAVDGLEAIDAALAFRPALLLIDLGLPGMSGLDVARRLRGEPTLRGAELVALTGYGGAETTHQCEEAGFDRHYTKPISEEALLGLLGAEGRQHSSA